MDVQIYIFPPSGGKLMIFLYLWSELAEIEAGGMNREAEVWNYKTWDADIVVPYISEGLILVWLLK